MAAIGGLLLILACANIAGLLMARGAERRSEIAVRLSIGASRLRLIRQLLTESIVLAAAGSTLGLLLTLWTRQLLLHYYAIVAEGYTRFYDLRIDPLILGFSLAVATGTGLLFGLMPAIHSTRSASPRRGRRTTPIVIQVALALVMLISAGLLAKSAAGIERGANFDPSGVAVLRLRPRLIQYTPAQAHRFTREVVRRLEALPGVESVGFARGLGTVWTQCCIGLVGVQDSNNRTRADFHVVSPHYFSTLPIRWPAGGEFSEHDRRGSPEVAIVDQTMAAE